MSLTTLNAYQQGGPVLDKLKQLWGYQEGGPVGPSRREFIKRMLSGLGGLWRSKYLPDISFSDVNLIENKLKARPTPWGWEGPPLLTGPGSTAFMDLSPPYDYTPDDPSFPTRRIDQRYQILDADMNPIKRPSIFDYGAKQPSGLEFIDNETGEVRPFWRKGGVEGAPAVGREVRTTPLTQYSQRLAAESGGVPGGGFRDWLNKIDADAHIVLAPEMTAHGITHPDMREVLLREAAKLKPGDVINPTDMLGKTGYFTRIGGLRSTIEVYKQGLEKIEREGPSAGWSKEEHLAHYQKQLAENEEALAELLQAKNQAQKKKGIKGLTLSDDALYHSGKFPGMLDSPVYDAPIPSGAWMGRAGRGLLMGLGALGGTAIDLAASPTPTGSGELPWLNPPTEYDLGYLGDLQGGADLSPILNELRAGTPVERPMSSRDWERRRTSEAFNRQLRGN